MQESIVFLVSVQCRRKESSRSLSHLMMSFLFISYYSQQKWPNSRPTVKKWRYTFVNVCISESLLKLASRTSMKL